MGKNNSSKTRVKPTFDWLMDSDQTGRTWLPRLLELGSRSDAIVYPRDPGELEASHPRWWGSAERRLKAPRSLLEWLVQNLSRARVEASGDKGDVLTRRLSLADKEPQAIAQALRLIRKGAHSRGAYLLEGESCPDACLQTSRITLVVEGKRTERTCTQRTKWMGKRSQMLRHMDAAYEVAGGRQILGLLVVEGPKAGDGLTPSEHWAQQASDQVTPEMLASSLPHRSPAQRALLASGFLGVTTWQAICAKCQVPFPPWPDAA